MSLNKIPSLYEFIKLMQGIPFVPSRHTYRLTEHFLTYDEVQLKNFCNSIMELRSKLEKCITCCCWKEEHSECTWCGSSRDQSIICIAESWIDTLSLERSGIFKGTYHILGGAISPLDGIMPEMLSFDILMKRLQDNPVSEIIIATNQTPEGDATASYLERMLHLKKISCSVSYLASGIPVGASLEFVDKLTLGKAFSHRRKI